MLYRILYLGVFLSLIIACQEDVSYYPKIVNYRNIQIDSIEFERLELNLNGYESSYYGYSFVDDSCIYYVDKYYCRLFVFTKDGNLLFRELGQGRGPREVNCKRISGAIKCQDHELLVLGYTLDHYFFRSDFEKSRVFLLENNAAGTIYEKSDTYTTFYPNLEIKNSGNSLYYNVYSECDDFNFIDTPEKYYEMSRTLMQVNKDNGKVERFFCFYPPFYQNNIGSYNAFPSLNYAFDSAGNLYVAFEADSTIYMYEKDKYPIGAFGYMGRDMNRNYIPIVNWKKCSEIMYKERNAKGYFTSLFVSPVSQDVLRTYQKGEPLFNGGLQIYRKGVLIGDVKTPCVFKIKGYMPPYYYSDIIFDVENEKMYVYRFKII